MRGSQALVGTSLLWLSLATPSCSTVIGIDGDYTDLVAGSAEQGGAAGRAGNGSSGASAGKAGSGAQAGSAAQAGSPAQAGSSAAGSGGQPGTKCNGVSSSGVCWHLGNLGDSCKETCANRGGVSPDAPSVIGTAAQGGSLAKCAALFDALGENAKPTEAKRSDDNGVGCHYYALKAYWLSAPDFTETAHLSSARIVCGCVQ